MLFKQKKPKQILALGGGAFSMEPDNGILDKYILNMALVKKPRICFLGTASDDGLEYREKFYDFYKNQNCEPFHLEFKKPPADIEEFIMSMDILHVGGGSTRKIIDTWKKSGADRIIKKAYEQGVIMTGMSAGAICWFEDGIFHDKDDSLKRLPCLGLLKGSFCPHYNDEGTNLRKTFIKLIEDGIIKSGYGVDDSAALHFVDGELIRVVSSQPGRAAYHVSKLKKIVTEKKLDSIYLGDDSLAKKEQEYVTKTIDTLTVVNSFIHMINDHKVDLIADSVTIDHTFYDSMGVDIRGLVNLKDAWGSLFSLFPDYTIEAKEIMVDGSEAVIFGEITGTFVIDDVEVKGKKWKVPSAWKVLIKDGKIAEWRVFTDMEPIREMRRRAKNSLEEMSVKIHGEKIDKN
ncbi:MAG TPA: Type 1 glutamine amidotransferase-like domain-containing protein [Ignavibacteria bacterium]|nr:Type 1 glutamine amidotransferase-like domain-containing protein [Ignavibacteria bacterium]